MHYLVAYDIASPRRLRRIACICEDYGIRIQKSLFECRLPSDDFHALWQELLTAFCEQEDTLMAWPICAVCSDRSFSAGTVSRPDFDEPLIF